MKCLLPLCCTPLVAAGLAAAAPVGAQAPGTPAVSPVQLTYRGGPLLPKVRVVNLFWGPNWKGSALSAYFNRFFRALFLDGRFMTNLAQYSTDSITIGDGLFGGADTDPQAPPATIQDADIRGEIQAQIAAGHLRKPDASTVYFVFPPPHTQVINAAGAVSARDFTGYHNFVPGSDGFAYAVIPYETTMPGPEYMTLPASHELAEAVTDPEPGDTTLGWYDNRNGEVGDIPVSLFAASRIPQSDFFDTLTASDGTSYLVQKEWSNQDNMPVAFALSASAPSS